MPLRKITYLFCALAGGLLLDEPARAQEQATAPSAEQPAAAQPKRLLRQVLIAESVEAAQALAPAPGAGFVVLSPTFSKVDKADLTRRLAAGENHPIDEKLLAAIAQVIENFFRQHDILVPMAIIPTQNIAEGVVRIAVLPGKLRNVKMQGNHWFSESLLREKLRLENGETLHLSELDRAISWTNNSPFRRVRVHAEPVPNTGEVDLTVAVQEALPLRLLFSYDNGGSPVLGEKRYTGSITYGNLWGRDHQASYQFITGDRPRLFQVHGFDYRIPLRWRHYLQFSTSYLFARPEFFEGLFVQDATTVTSDIRYTVPVRTGDNPAEVFASVNFKESNNNLAFGGNQVLGIKTDIFQFTAGGSMVRRDRRGAWVFGASATISPGGINNRNTNEAFDASRYGTGDSARFGATATYAYGSISVQRLLSLAPGWDFMSRALIQGSQANLLSSEQLTIGGMSTVRGFPENIFSGDNGFVFSNEILMPAWKQPLPRISKTKGPLETRGLLFLDIARVSVHQAFPFDPPHRALAGAGVGLRMNLAGHFSLTADYGWQITDLPYQVDRHSRGHIKASLAF